MLGSNQLTPVKPKQLGAFDLRHGRCLTSALLIVGMTVNEIHDQLINDKTNNIDEIKN